MFSERAEFLQRAKWGIFMHFLARELYAPMDSARWNAEVEAFDAEKLASQLAEIGAGYFFLTLGQNSGWFCSPNRTLDRLTNREGNGRSRCSRRDLIADMAAALQPYRIPLLVYLPCHGPAGDTEAMIALDGIPPWDYQLWSPREREVLDRYRSSDPRLRKFLRNWEAVIREWSERWGTRVCGWWFDGCYFKERLYDFPDEPNFASLAAAVRAGNPRSVFATNPGVFRDPVAISAEEDYTSGENTRPDLSCCRTPSVDGALYHILTFAGNNWCALPLRYGADEVAQITGNIVAGGGVVSWDVPYNRSDGTLPAEVMKCFRSLRARLDGERPALSISGEVKRIPESGVRNGEAMLRIHNPSRHTVNEVAQITGNEPFPVRLAPGKVREYPVLLPESTRRLEIVCGNCRRFLDYPVRQCFKLPADGGYAPLPPVVVGEEALGNFELAVIDGAFHLRGRVRESETRVDPDFWRGSGLELFLWDGLEVTQRFFPAYSGEHAGWRLENHRYLPVESCRWKMVPRDGGYEFELAWAEFDFSGAFQFDLKLSCRDNGYFRRGTLGGSREPQDDPSLFVSVEPERR